MSGLINPGLCTILPLDLSATMVDELAGEHAIEPTYGAQVQLLGQLDYRSDRARQQAQEGGGVDSLALLTVMITTATTAGWDPKVGDRLIGYEAVAGDTETSNLYVSRVRKNAPWFTRYVHYEVDLTDREPTRLADLG